MKGKCKCDKGVHNVAYHRNYDLQESQDIVPSTSWKVSTLYGRKKQETPEILSESDEHDTISDNDPSSNNTSNSNSSDSDSECEESRVHSNKKQSLVKPPVAKRRGKQICYNEGNDMNDNDKEYIVLLLLLN